MVDQCNCKIKIIFNEEETPRANIKEEKINVDFNEQFKLVVPTKHNELLNLDYENSGHTGFASAQELQELKELTNNFYNDFKFSYVEQTGKLILTLIDANKKETSVEVDLPTEELVKNVSYDKNNNIINIEWQNGQTTEIALSGLVDVYKADEETITLDKSTNTFKLKDTWIQTLVASIPTKTSQLTNDSDFVTKTVSNLTNYYLKTETYTKEEVAQLLGTISSLSIKVVESLPTTNISTNSIYLVRKTTTTTTNIYDEYIYINDSWEKIGDTQINLDGYAKVDDIPTKLSQLEIDVELGSITDLGKIQNYNELNNVREVGYYVFTTQDGNNINLMEVELISTYYVVQTILRWGVETPAIIKRTYAINQDTWTTTNQLFTLSTDIIDKLDSNVTNKPLSANQGRVLNEKITIDNERETTVAVGGIAKGTSLNGLDVKTVIENIFFPYVAFSMGNMSTSPSAGGVYEKGKSVTLNSVTVPITMGSKSLTNITLYDSDGTTVLAEKTSGITTSNTFSNLGKSIGSKVTFKATATDGTTSLSKTISVYTFVDPYFYGALDQGYELNTDTVTGGTKQVVSKGNKTYSFTTNAQHPYIAFPSSYGNLKSILDGNNFENIDSFTKYTVNIAVASGTVSYNVYVQNNAPTLNGFSYTFKF